MEEQEKGKVVKMNVSDKEGADQKKLTYEQLNGVCNKLYQENQYLKGQLQQASETIRLFNRLDYLFKIVALAGKSTAEHHFNGEFVAACIQEIEEAMTLPEKEEKEKEGD